MYDVCRVQFLYSTYVRPHLEHGKQAVGPHMSRDLKVLERVQRRATKMVYHLRHLPYGERFTNLKLLRIEKRILRGDLIEAYKILTRKLNLDPNHFFELNEDTRTRGRGMKLLPQEVVSEEYLKNGLDKYWAVKNMIISFWSKKT